MSAKTNDDPNFFAEPATSIAFGLSLATVERQFESVFQPTPQRGQADNELAKEVE